MQGPDFPTAGIIHGRAGIVEAYKTRPRPLHDARQGRRSRTFNKDRKAIVVTEIPYQVNKARLIERIAELVNDKVIDDISDIRDESDRDGMRIVVELKRGAEPQIVLNQLFKHTQMQESFSMILLAVVNGQPKEMGLVQAIKHFIDHRVDVVRRRTAYLLPKAKDREHILEGYLTALDHLDNVITIIRASANRAEARENLVAYFGGKKIDINITGRAPKRDPEKPFTAKPGRRHPRTATAPPDPALDRRNLERIERQSARTSPSTNPFWLGEEAARRDRQRTGRSKEALRRRAPHASSKTKPPKSISKT